MMPSLNNLPHYLRIALFCIFFILISFFPQPVQDQYRGLVRAFLAIFLLGLLDKRNFKHLFHFRDWPLWIFLICLSAGIAFAIDKQTAVFSYFYLATAFFLIFYIGKGLYSYGKDRPTVNLIICICSCLVAVIGLLELYYGKNMLYENFIHNPFYIRYIKYNPRPMSTQLNPAVLGSYLLGCLPFSFYLFKNKSLGLRLLGIFSSLLSMFVIILTFSRGVMLGLVALLLFYLWNKQKKRIFFLFFFGSILSVSFCSCQKNVNLNRFGFKRLILGSYDSVISEYRFNRVKMTFKILKDYPLFGIGFNHFRIRFDEYCGQREKGKELDEFMIADNMYLTFLAESGLTGAFAFLIFIIFMFKKGARRIQETLIPMSALVGLLVNMGGYDLFYWNNPYMLFCLICGFIWGSISPDLERED